jgi:hypothetical protein
MRAYTKRACMQCGRSWGRGVKLGMVTLGGSRLCVDCTSARKQQQRGDEYLRLERLYREAMQG